MTQLVGIGFKDPDRKQYIGRLFARLLYVLQYPRVGSEFLSESTTKRLTDALQCAVKELSCVPHGDLVS